jgi:formate hydrogenlyase subunit 4
MVLEYSGRHLAMLELASFLKLLLYVARIACAFVPWGLAPVGSGVRAAMIGLTAFAGKLAIAGALLAVSETSVANMRGLSLMQHVVQLFLRGVHP